MYSAATPSKQLVVLYHLVTNLLGIAAHFIEEDKRNDIRFIDTPFSKYKGHVAILQHSATEIFSTYVGHDVDVASLLQLPVSKITWGEQGRGRQYVFVLGKGSIDSPEEIKQVLSEALTVAIDYWKNVRSELASIIHFMK